MARLKYKWDKSKSSKFTGYAASGVYNFYLNFRSGKYFEVTAFAENGILAGHKLYYVEQEPYKAPTVHKEIGIFKAALEAKHYAERLLQEVQKHE